MRSSAVDRLLDSAFRIRPGEASRVGLMFLTMMGVVSIFIVGRTVRDTLFLSRYPVERLPLMYVGVALGVAVSSYAYSRFADRHRRDRLLVRSFLLFALVIVVFWASLFTHRGGDWIYPLLYIAVEIIGAISVIQFWTFANDLYNAREAKRLFGFIGAGGVVANILCGFGIGSIAPIVGSENLLLLCVLLFGFCAFTVRRLGVAARRDLEAAVRRPRKSQIGLASDGEAVLHSKHLKTIAGIVALTFVAVTLVDFQFKVIAKETYQEAELASFFGFFYGCTGLVASAVQFFGTSRLLERGGIVVSLMVLPIGMVAGAGAILMVPFVGALAAATVAKGSENIFRYTINDATMQLLYMPVSPQQRGRAKAFIDGILKPMSIGAAGLLLVCAGKILPKQTLALDLAYLDLVVLISWILLVVGIRREYVLSLINTLHTRRLISKSVWTPPTDEHTLKVLARSLASRSEARVLHALELLPAIQASFQAELLALLEHPSKRVRAATLRLIAASGQFAHPDALPALLRDEDEEVRAAAISAFCAVGRESAVRASHGFLIDPSILVRGAAVAAMIKHGGLDGILTAAGSLKSFFADPDEAVRIQGARVLAEIKVKNFFHPVLELLQDREPGVRFAAVEAAGAMQSPELVAALIYKLAYPETAEAAIRALSGYGASIERTLLEVLADERADLAIRRRIPRILGRIGDEQAMQPILASLTIPDHEARMAVARAASQIRDRCPLARFDQRLLSEAIERQLGACYQTLAILEDLALPQDALLPEALGIRHGKLLALVFRLLESRYPSRTIQLVYTNLGAESKPVRANALEVVDNLVSKEESRMLLPLLEDQGRAEKVRIGAEFFSLERRTREAWIRQLLADEDAWIITCALHLAGAERLQEFREQVVLHLKSRDAVVRETACMALARLVGGEGNRGPSDDHAEIVQLARAISEDQSPEVRRASTTLLEVLSA